MTDTQITEDLAAALHALVDASDAAERTPTDAQAARRAIEQALVVVKAARSEGFGRGDATTVPGTVA